MKARLIEELNRIVNKFKSNKLEVPEEDWMLEDYDPDFDDETNFDYDWKKDQADEELSEEVEDE